MKLIVTKLNEINNVLSNLSDKVKMVLGYYLVICFLHTSLEILKLIINFIF